jgi:colanic acid biosynthesis glycosyl transferase WcaI
MRILFLVQNYPPERGPVRYTRDLALALAARGHKVEVITGLPHYPFGAPYPGFGRFRTVARTEDGVRVIRVPLVMGSNTQVPRRLAGFLTFALSALPRALGGRRPDVIVASCPPLTVVPLGLLAARLRRVPCVAMLRDVEPVISLQLRGMEDRFWARALTRAALAMYRAADRRVVVHESQRDTLIGLGIDPAGVETIPHGIDVPAFVRRMETDAPPALPRREGRRLGLYLGTIGVAHDLRRLVLAFADEKVRSLPLDLAIVGDGECRAECERLVAERGLESVRILPPVPLEAVPATLGAADVLFHSYRTGAAPIPGQVGSKLYEYFAAARPVIVAGDGYATRLVLTIGNGWTCRADDPASVAAAIRRYLADPAAAAELGLRGRAYAAEHFAASARHDRWEALLAQTVEDRNTARPRGRVPLKGAN